MELIATLPPLARHRDLIIGHSLVNELRFNTVEPVKETPEEVLRCLQAECGEKRLWIDLKARQLRITSWADPEYEVVELSHRISVDLPAKIHFKECVSTIVEIVDGNRLILEDAPRFAVGKGQPVNIKHPSLVIEGVLTEKDKRYIRAAKKLGMHGYMLSFTENLADIEAVLKEDSRAEIVAKIESPKGIDFVQNDYLGVRDKVRIMAARDDLFMNLEGREVAMLAALELMVARDPNAIVASRILTSLEASEQVAWGDIADLELMYRLGYRRFMLSDGLCGKSKAFERVMPMMSSFIDERVQKETEVQDG